MGNLGAYQDIVVKAKDAGGVEKLIESIEKAAAWKAMPKGFAAGIAATIAAVAVVKQYSKRGDAHEAEANRAKAQLTGDFVEATDSDELEVEGGEAGAEESTEDSPSPENGS
ncbi:hypothetical protein [Nocardioides ungokensis]